MLAATALATPALAQPLFWSTQAAPVEETQAMREQVLAGYLGGVDYQASDPGPWLTRLQAELQAMSLAASYGSQGVANLASDASRILQEARHLAARPEGEG